MKVYAVFKQGVYRHECGGIFTTLTRAQEVAESLLTNEEDMHHTFDVVPFVINQATPYNIEDQDYGLDTRPLLEPDPVYMAKILRK